MKGSKHADDALVIGGGRTMAQFKEKYTGREFRNIASVCRRLAARVKNDEIEEARPEF